jgi:hypothetical protein
VSAGPTRGGSGWRTLSGMVLSQGSASGLFRIWAQVGRFLGSLETEQTTCHGAQMNNKTR